jgi:uncharacterized protein YodC (DUF2158 family)
VSASGKKIESKGDFRKLGLGLRATNALADQGIFGIEDLARYTDQEFAGLPGIGAETYKTVQHYLRKSVQPHDKQPEISLVPSAAVLTAKFKEGDLVELIAGGPVMVVDKVDQNREGYSCTWFADKKRERAHFRAATLKQVEMPHK